MRQDHHGLAALPWTAPPGPSCRSRGRPRGSGCCASGRPVPLLVDEWQLVPEVLGAVKRAVDEGAAAGSFVLT
ncbi:MAG TPA: hypothetical protein VH520_08415, partial [Streptosporangiaceae bacterium]